MISKRLGRQLKKSLGSDDFKGTISTLKAAIDASGVVTDDNRESLEKWLLSFPEFLETVDRTYAELDEKAVMAQRNIELSSAELTESNSSLLQLNQTFAALLDSLGQAFLLFDHEGKCLTTYSRSCLDILEIEPGGKAITEVLRVPSERVVFFDKWRDLLFFGEHEFDSLVEIAPKTFPSSDSKRSIFLEFKPVRDALGKLLYVVVVATDRSVEVQAQKEAHEMHAFATLVTSVLRDRQEFQKFVQMCGCILSGMEKDLSAEAIDDTQMSTLKRHLHTLKGGAASFGLLKMSEFIHEAESRLGEVSSLEEAHRLLVSTTAQIKHLLSQTLEAHRDLLESGADPQARMREVSVNELRAFYEGLRSRSIADPADEFMSRFLAVPVPFMFRHFTRILGEDAKKVGKEIDPLEVIAQPDLRLIPEMYEDVTASLVHVLRNMADHGIETPERRLALGKPRAGHVRLEVERIKNKNLDQLLITFSDDGSGINVDRIRKKIGDAATGLSDAEIMDMIFKDGMSTAEQVTTMSGRGVGMGAVRQAVERLGGKITVNSKAAKGTTFTIVVPLFEDFSATASASRGLAEAS